MNTLYSELQWLPRPPQDFFARLKGIDVSGESAGDALSGLAAFGLDLNQLLKLSKIMQRARLQGSSLRPLTPFRLAILSNSTVDLISPAVSASAARYGICLEIVDVPYDQVAQEALSPDSRVNRSHPDAVLFALDYRAFTLTSSPGDPQAASACVQNALDYLRALRDGIRNHAKCVCIFQTFAPPAARLFGSLDRALPGTLRSLIESINSELARYVAEAGEVLLDVAGLAETVGLAEWHDQKLWNLGKFPFSDQLVPLYADHVGRTVAAIRGKSKKGLILDLDNTIWGGVAGDDGFEGIRMAQGDAQGEAFLAVQRFAISLWERGIVLAVSSKNTDAVVRDIFARHPDMLLKLDHIAVFQANWNDKASNIRAIADELSLGLDAFVFLDDNPVERELVRRLLPGVAVPELTSDPSEYVDILAAAGYFEAISFTADDQKRSGYYRDNARRSTLRTMAAGIDEYLASLDMTVTFQPFDETGRARIAQLINKSNQYNLTTRRYTEAEVALLESDPNVFTLQVRLTDVFGDNGMISVVICRRVAGAVWEIDTWLMSCRVLGRKVENAVLQEIVHHAVSAGMDTLRGRYVPSGRNQLVSDHYARLGFAMVSEDSTGTTCWELPVNKAAMETLNMKVLSHGFRSDWSIAHR